MNSRRPIQLADPIDPAAITLPATRPIDITALVTDTTAAPDASTGHD
ncbi:hypothetical protein [Microbacterium rhizosphaerae]|uniref:Uncharacterized protein n=1 Tax=Microbacterium rhizosphaerae TaxID=1678237 RepID=A0ABZ0SMI1_9MICO|nr:hypothetical protein [Microbacterium rhizosphaerae]WPR90189.1 hypothetical protein SM116_02565 [Microbacterium rhizosphaerae]